MKHQVLDGILFAQMIKEGAKRLGKYVKQVDALNVFPVPDGDTGTNMNLSFTSGVNEMSKVSSSNISEVTKALSKGLLMGARGNSGVILSQLFRGFSKYAESFKQITAQEFAQGLQQGVETAYKAVMKPVEGTILTVSKDAARVGQQVAKQTDNITEVMEAVLQEAKASLKRTPDLLPVLKQVGVIDSGGQGLVYVYEGFLKALKGEFEDEQDDQQDADYSYSHSKEDHVRDEVAEMMAAGVLSVEDIIYGYCTEFMIRLDPAKATYNEHLFRKNLNQFGDSLLVISDDELVKVHIHAEELHNVFEQAQKYGGLMNIKIENMREQFLSIKETRGAQESADPVAAEPKTYGFITVSMGNGIKEVFQSLGADVVIAGGQTMNPSTEDFVKAINQVNAEHIIILPNNSNIILAAEQSADLVEKQVVVIPSRNVPQGMAAMLHFNPTASLAENQSIMKEALTHVKSGQITYAIRDTQIDGHVIKEGDYMGLSNGKIVATATDTVHAFKALVAQMIDEDSEIMTVFYGEDVQEDEIESLREFIEEAYPDIELELYDGGQPLYSYIISVE